MDLDITVNVQTRNSLFYSGWLPAKFSPDGFEKHETSNVSIAKGNWECSVYFENKLHVQQNKYIQESDKLAAFLIFFDRRH